MRSRLIIALVLLLSASSGQVLAKDKKLIDHAAVAKIDVALIEDVDKFQGLTRWAPKRGRDIGGTSFLSTMSVNPVFFRLEDGTSGYYLRAQYSGFGWLFLTGEAIVVLDDGTRITLTGNDSSAERKVESCSGGAGCLVSEGIRIPISKEQLDRISTAKTAEIRFNGGKAYLQGYLKNQHVAAIRAVLEVGSRESSTNP